MFNDVSELANRFGLSPDNPDNAKQLKRFEYNCYVYSKGGVDKVCERATALGVHDGSTGNLMTKDEFLLLVFKTLNAEPGKTTLSPLGKMRGDKMIEEYEFKGTVEAEPIVEEKKPASMMDALGDLFGSISPQESKKEEVAEDKTTEGPVEEPTKENVPEESETSNEQETESTSEELPTEESNESIVDTTDDSDSKEDIFESMTESIIAEGEYTKPDNTTEEEEEAEPIKVDIVIESSQEQTETSEKVKDAPIEEIESELVGDLS